MHVLAEELPDVVDLERTWGNETLDAPERTAHARAAPPESCTHCACRP
jgi:hypothetical protein